MTKTILTTLALVAATALYTAAATPVTAAGSNCQVIYGGGEVCPPDLKISIDKKVKSLNQGGLFVDNLSINDTKYKPSQEVPYKVIVKNVGEATLKNIQFQDDLPSYLVFSNGSRTHTETIAELKAGETKEINLTAKVVDAGSLPADKSVICDNTTNTAKVFVNNGTFSDTAQICIEKNIPQKDGGPVVQQTPPMKQTPSTGPELFALAALVPTGAAGIFLRRRAVK